MKFKFTENKEEGLKWKKRFLFTLGILILMGIYTAITYEPDWKLLEEINQMSLLRD